MKFWQHVKVFNFKEYKLSQFLQTKSDGCCYILLVQFIEYNKRLNYQVLLAEQFACKNTCEAHFLKYGNRLT